MKGALKAMIAGIIIIAIGAAVLIGTLAFNGWSFKRPEFEMLEYSEYSGDTIDIDLDAGTVKTQFYDGDKVIISYPSSSVYNHKIEVEGGTLKFKSNLKLFHPIGLDIPDTVISLPSGSIYNLNIEVSAGSSSVASGTYGNLQINVDAGSVTADSIECARLSLDVDAGSIEIKSAVCPSFFCDLNMGSINIKKLTCDSADVKVNMGENILSFTGAKEEYNITADVAMGSCNVSSQNGTTQKRLNLKVDMGTLNVDFGA